MTGHGRWSHRMWWAAPATFGTIGALGVAAAVLGPSLADSVSMPSAVTVGGSTGLAARDQPVAQPPAPRATPHPARQSLSLSPRPRPVDVLPHSASAAKDTVKPTSSNAPQPAPTQVVPAQRPVVETPSPEPSGKDDGWRDTRGDGGVEVSDG